MRERYTIFKCLVYNSEVKLNENQEFLCEILNRENCFQEEIFVSSILHYTPSYGPLDVGDVISLGSPWFKTGS